MKANIIPRRKPSTKMPTTLSASKQNILLSVRTAIVRVFGDKPVLGGVALEESVKRSLHLLQLVAGDVADQCLEMKYLEFFFDIDDSSLHKLARQCRRQALSLQEASQPKATVGIPKVAPLDVVPTVSAKRQRSAPNVNDQELVATNVNDVEVDFDALDALFTTFGKDGGA